MKNIKPTHLLTFFLALFAVAAGYNYFNKPILNYLQKISEKNTLAEKIAQIGNDKSDEEILIEMYSAQEKIYQLLAVPVIIDSSVTSEVDLPVVASATAELTGQADSIEAPEFSFAWIDAHHPGAVVIFGDKISTASAKAFSTKLQQHVLDGDVVGDAADNARSEKKYYSPIIAVDHEGGSIQRLNGAGFTILPSWKEVCALPLEKQTSLFEKSAKELAEVGINMVLAPSLDLAKNHPIYKTRFCGDQEQLYQAADAMILAFANNGILSVVKHFPGIGKTSLDLHKNQQSVDVAVEDMQMFAAILNKYSNIGLMSAHLVVKNNFSDIPCSLSQECLSYVKKDYPNVLLVSDAIEMQSALDAAKRMLPGATTETEPSTSAVMEKATEQAILAGNDLIIFGRGVSTNDVEKIAENLAVKYQNDEQFKKRVDESFVKVMGLKR